MTPGYGIDNALNAVVVAGIVAANAFFVAAEFALVKVREFQLEPLAAAGEKRAVLARHIVRNINRYLSATQLGITMASLGLGWIGEPVFATLLGPLLRWKPPRFRRRPGVRSRWRRGSPRSRFCKSWRGSWLWKWLAIQNPLQWLCASAAPCSVVFPPLLPRSQLGLEPRGPMAARQARGLSPWRATKEDTPSRSCGFFSLGQKKGARPASLGWDIVLNALSLRSEGRLRCDEAPERNRGAEHGGFDWRMPRDGGADAVFPVSTCARAGAWIRPSAWFIARTCSRRVSRPAAEAARTLPARPQAHLCPRVGPVGETPPIVPRTEASFRPCRG